MHAICFTSLFIIVAQNSDASYEVRRYVRPAGKAYTLESEIAFKKTATGSRYESVTHRGSTKMRLVVEFDTNRNPTAANIRLKNNGGTHMAEAEFTKTQIVVKTKAKEPIKLEIKLQPVLATTAPDWSDIILLLRRYDQQKGGLQKFAGLWFHPEKPSRILTFNVEKKKPVSIKSKDKKIPLAHYRVRLRSGNYDVWAASDGLVYKLSPASRPQSAVILKGFECTVQSLTP